MHIRIKPTQVGFLFGSTRCCPPPSPLLPLSDPHCISSKRTFVSLASLTRLFNGLGHISIKNLLFSLSHVIEPQSLDQYICANASPEIIYKTTGSSGKLQNPNFFPKTKKFRLESFAPSLKTKSPRLVLLHTATNMFSLLSSMHWA